jgi:hypothetical protein
MGPFVYPDDPEDDLPEPAVEENGDFADGVLSPDDNKDDYLNDNY